MPVMVAVRVAALSLSLLLQQESASEFLKKVEKRYVDATSLKMSLEARRVGTVAGEEVNDTWMGKFYSKGEAQVYLEVWGSKIRTKWITDGATMALVVGKLPQKKPHTLTLGPWGRRSIVRAGMFEYLHSLQGSVFKSKNAVNFEGLFKVKDPADAGVEKVDGVECRVVACSFVPPEGAPMKCRLWIDPRNLVLLKRETVKKSASESYTLTESFIAPVFDGEIKDDQFRIP